MHRTLGWFVGVALSMSMFGCDGTVPARGRRDRVMYSDGGVPPDAAGLRDSLPCAVANVVGGHCVLCHGTTPTGMAPSLITREDFAAPSTADPTRSRAAVAVEWMRSSTAHRMPPLPAMAVPEADIAAFEQWVADGLPQGSCSIDDPFDVPPQCTTNRTWTFGNAESPLMRPGGACIDCHTTSREGPYLSLAGTVYQTAHEPDDCNGGPAPGTNLSIEVTDATGHVITMAPNATGNFFSQDRVTFPITARVSSTAGAREMTTPVMSGDCNGCHTQTGAMDARGRIIVP